jgi:hypothetical protein
MWHRGIAAWVLDVGGWDEVKVRLDDQVREGYRLSAYNDRRRHVSQASFDRRLAKPASTDRQGGMRDALWARLPVLIDCPTCRKWNLLDPSLLPAW